MCLNSTSGSVKGTNSVGPVSALSLSNFEGVQIQLQAWTSTEPTSVQILLFESWNYKTHDVSSGEKKI